jgi:hypothetical protein
MALISGYSAVDGLTGFQLGIANTGNQISFQTWGDGSVPYRIYPIPFDPSAVLNLFNFLVYFVFKLI